MSLVPHRSDFDEAVGLLLVYMATSPTRIYLGPILRTLADLGWSRAGGAPLGEGDVHPVWNQIWDAVGAVGVRPAGARDRVPSAAAVALIRDALLAPGSPSPLR